MKPRKRLPRISPIEIFILATLVPAERYGLEIVDAIKKATQGKVVISLSGLYTTLDRMEEKGLSLRGGKIVKAFDEDTTAPQLLENAHSLKAGVFC